MPTGDGDLHNLEEIQCLLSARADRKCPKIHQKIIWIVQSCIAIRDAYLMSWYII